MDEAYSAVLFGADGEPYSPAARGARPHGSIEKGRFGGWLLALLTLQAAAFVHLTASSKIPAVVLDLFRALLIL
jgi:hypothetical protein